MLDVIDIGDRSLAAYQGVAPDEQLEELVRVSQRLRGARILHLNATSYGGGVSEILRSCVPLLKDLGLQAEWKIIRGDDAFFQITKRLHNGLQGAPGELSETEKALYLGNAQLNAPHLAEGYDFVIVHDPQPAAIAGLARHRGSRWIWRCHIDTSHPNPAVWEFLTPYLAAYDAAVFTLENFIPPHFPIRRVAIIPPAIDPLSPKNLALPKALARHILEWIGVRLDQPLVTQVSRFDKWKDPLGVVAAYRLVRQRIPQLQLALVSSMALDDPEAWDIYGKVRADTAGDPLIHVFTNLVGVGNVEVNAFQSLSDVVIQKSLREGFGLVVSEALWKGTPIVAGRVGGIPMQMPPGTGGILVDSIEECAEALIHLLLHPRASRALGESGRERVRHHFLMPRLLLDELLLLERLAGEQSREDPHPSPLPEGEGAATVG
ncbi:glycosyltransferase [Archangium violaceum]|uniref:Glycosyl transferase family 1 n=1 Tax=Archangium violaceum Cb vi76 TaxID=1406225 RepID=A0A084SU82_9BACT|nr:glycosyltransferase [Archangium violaceum]KFA92017.1 glycosyl transferase family 1 [Archangium violaceum Cb vi76]